MPIPSGMEAKQKRNNPHRVHQLNVSNLLSDPFAVSSLSMALISWIIAIAGSIAAATSESFPRFTWWGIVYQFLIIVALILFYIFDLIDYYKNFLSGAIAVAFVYTTNSATNLVYSDGSRMAAASAGVILLSMVNLIWIFYYGGDNAAPTNRWIDSFSVKGLRHSVLESSLALNSRPLPASRHVSKYSSSPNDMYRGSVQQPNNFYPETHSQHYVSSTALNGFENAEPPVAPAFAGDLGDPHNTNTFITDTTNGNTETTMGDTLGLYSDIGDELSSFPYTAKALYAYNADESDAYEISFEQGEILRVGDIEGRWWKAKRANGQTGIIPSNYVELVENGSV
ncbi:LAFE_0B09362g1_1 [Lachancea fermentati]|uniref:High osmolarity signaling protein SHO1 n=1 Tax=Lachancea fermentati TaxID=4955 RepID=A0A1G4M8C9_LACFM|nr:LAFE_0B09362g1_1 [Lachancea fermentati]